MSKNNILNKIGMNIRLKGYWYWEEAIKICKTNKYFISSFPKMMTIYNQIAKKFDVTPESVERCMRSARLNIKKLDEKMNIPYNIRNSTLLAWLIKEA